jgi:putative ABC transport system permease protein
MALGVYITFRLLDFADLSVDGSFATGGAVAVMLIRGEMSPWLSLLLAFIVGMVAGLVTGLLNTKLGIPPILAGILTQIALYSVNLNIMGCSNQAVSVDKYNLVVSLRYISGDAATIFRIFATCILFCAAVVIVLYWFFGTEQGHAIRATGCNPNMARAQGINTGFCKVVALMLSNGLVGLSGALYAQYQGASDVNMGRGAIVIGLAAVIIGEVIFGKLCAGKKFSFAYTMLAVIAGAIIYYLVLNVILWLKFPSDDLKLFSAIVVAIFLAIPYLKDQHKAAKGA